MTERLLAWPGTFNVRDLGGLPARSGPTRFGQFVRAGHPSSTTAEGWRAVRAYGVRTVVDLTDPDDPRPDASPRPDGITTLSVPMDDMSDDEFWTPMIESGHWGTALYYRGFLDRFPQRVAAVMTALRDRLTGASAHV